jgi:hypothetical protein
MLLAVRLLGQEWRLLLLLLLCYVYFLPRYADWSQSSRVALILAVVTQGRLEIDDFAAGTGDYAEVNGHQYSDKAPGLALLGVPPYAAARLLLTTPLGERTVERLANGEALRQTLKPGEAARDKVDFALAQAIATWATVALPAALLGVALFRVLAEIVPSERARLLVTLAYGLATPAFAYAGALYSHQLTAVLLFISFALVWKQRQPGPGRLLLVGLLLGLALISEYPIALIAGGIGLYLLAVSRSVKALVLVAVGSLPMLAVMGIHNWLIFGTPLPVGYSYSTLWQAEHQTGFFSLSVPTVEAFWGITFSPYRGLFFVAPFLLLGVAGLVLLPLRRSLRAEALLAAWCVLSFVLFNSSSVMWTGGFAVGPRYLVPMLPFLALGVGAAVQHWGSTPWFRLALSLSLVWSVAVTWSLTIGGQSFPGFDHNPLLTQSLPALLAGDVARNLGTLAGLTGWWSLLPLLLLVGLLLPYRRTPQSGGEPLTTTAHHVEAAPRGVPSTAGV